MTVRLEDPGALLSPERKARIDAAVARRTRTLTVVLEAFADLQNASAVMRTCEAFGIQDIHVVPGPGKRNNRHKKISQNADKWLDVIRWKSTTECLNELRERGFTLYATHLEIRSLPLQQLPLTRALAPKVALIFGNEHAGVSAEACSLCDQTFRIPMNGLVESFNVSVAAAISIARADAERRIKGDEGGDLSEEDKAALRRRFYISALKQHARFE